MALLQSFFDQGLWIEDYRFTEQLKVELARIQKPFPTSCRTDVNNLKSDQITLAYQAFTDSVADLISECSAIGKDSDDKLNRKVKLCPLVLDILRSGPVTLEHEIKKDQQVAIQREAEAQREAAAELEATEQRKAANQKEADEVERVQREQRESASQLEAEKQRETDAQREATKEVLRASLRDPVKFHPVIVSMYIWMCRIIGVVGCLATLLAILGIIFGDKNPGDPGIGGIIVGILVMLLIFGGMTFYGFRPRKKKGQANQKQS